MTSLTGNQELKSFSGVNIQLESKNIYKANNVGVGIVFLVMSFLSRWSRTPLDEALHFGHLEVANLLKDRGGESVVGK